MSAYIVADGTMDTIVQMIMRRDPSVIGPQLTALRDAGADQLGRALYAMNAKAVAQRFCETQQDRDSYTYQPHPEYSFARAAMAARCLRDQCSHGTVPTSGLYADLTVLVEQLTYKFAGQADYLATPWHITRPDDAAAFAGFWGWTQDDADVASAEGWLLYDRQRGAEGRFILATDDLRGIFAGDEQVWSHVIAAAQAGGQLHQRAIAFLLLHSPTEWWTTISRVHPEARQLQLPRAAA